MLEKPACKQQRKPNPRKLRKPNFRFRFYADSPLKAGFSGLESFRYRPYSLISYVTVLNGSGCAQLFWPTCRNGNVTNVFMFS